MIVALLPDTGNAICQQNCSLSIPILGINTELLYEETYFSFFLCGATMFPAFSQTYQELSERAVAATEQDSLSLAENTLNKL